MCVIFQRRISVLYRLLSIPHRALLLLPSDPTANMRLVYCFFPLKEVFIYITSLAIK